jgi:hypothetical protein
MTSSKYSSAATSRIPIDTEFLLRQVSSLVQVKRRRRTWNEFGENVIDYSDHFLPKARRPMPDDEPADESEAVCWNMAKELIHSVVASQDPTYDGIRKRLGNLREPSTPLLLSTLSLWLAGVLGMSVSVTGPLVAAMLFGVAEAGGDWGALRI